MRRYKKLIPVALLMWILPSLLFASCAKQGTKTVVMEDSASTAGTSGDTGLHSGRIYKFNYFNVIDNKPVNEMLFGWLDKENAAAVTGNQEDYLTIEAINYKYHFTKEIMKITSDMVSYTLSPDGKKIAYIKGEKLFIKDVQEDKDKEIGQLQLLRQGNASISWSNNGRFITFALSSLRLGIEQVCIYDSTVQRMYGISLKEAAAAAPASELIPAKITNYNATVSDDGTKLLINSIYDNGDYKVEYLAHLYKLNKDTFGPETEIKISDSYMGYSYFIGNNRIMYLNMRNSSLDIYNTDTGGNSVIYKFDRSGMKYPYFRVSNDGKAIVFVKYLQDGTVGIYEAGLQNDQLEGERMIYQDFVPNTIWWSGDNKKVLLSGRYVYNEKVDGTRQLNPSYVSLGSIIIELN